jgi:hypothetical protein
VRKDIFRDLLKFGVFIWRSWRNDLQPAISHTFPRRLIWRTNGDFAS